MIAKKTEPTDHGEFIKWHNIPIGTVQKVKSEHGKKETVARILPVNNGTWCNVKSRLKLEKTILIVGVTGAGKSTLIDAIANFIFNVRYEDGHRLKLIDLTKEEKEKVGNEALSQTSDISIYKIPCIGDGNVPFNLNIIDTPGYFLVYFCF